MRFSPRSHGMRVPSQLLDILRVTEKPADAALEASVLPSFCQPSQAAVLRYALALERELAQVQAWARELERHAQKPRGMERVKRRLLKI